MRRNRISTVALMAALVTVAFVSLLWLNGTLEQRQLLQKVVFPDGGLFPGVGRAGRVCQVVEKRSAREHPAC